MSELKFASALKLRYKSKNHQQLFFGPLDVALVLFFSFIRGVSRSNTSSSWWQSHETLDCMTLNGKKRREDEKKMREGEA